MITTNKPRGEFLSIYWTDIHNATSSDWIGIYSPSDSPDDDEFDRFPNTNGTKSGEFTYYVINMRSGTLLGKFNFKFIDFIIDYLFKYWRYDSETQQYDFVGTSNTVAFEGGPNEVAKYFLLKFLLTFCIASPGSLIYNRAY